MPQFLDPQQESAKAYSPEGEERQVLDHIRTRVLVLKDTKKRILNNINFEDIMKAADDEYQPHNLREQPNKVGRSVMLVQDEITGLRGSRIVKITGQEGQEWRSDTSEPTLLTKIQTAISILVDQNPEAVFKALLKKYKPTSAIAQAIWKRSWGIAKSKDQLKIILFNMAKYGWAPARTYPRIVQRPKDILVELDTEHPEKNKYKTVMLTEFNDVYREALDPWRTWIDDMANMTDPWSLDDWYFEKDYSKDAFELEFGQYENSDKITFGAFTKSSPDEPDVNEETKKRDDIITLGFYESKRKDLYGIYSPNDDVVIYYSPLPNDDGLLSLWDQCWNIRDPKTRYGIGLFEILKNNKVLYDRLDNMDIDSLVLSIYTMLFYSGTNSLVGDGQNVVSPGLLKQKLPGTTVDQIKLDYSGKGREGADQQRERIDELTGITPTLQGQVEGKTLGEVLHAKDAALKRLNIPLSNLASGLEQDAYLTLSWGNMIYSLPEVMEFLSQDELDDYMKETEREPTRVVPSGGGLKADFPRVLDLSLDTDRDGTLIESPEARFFIVGGEGEDGLEKRSLNWKGQIVVNPQSIVAASQELDRQRKLELFNLVYPTVQAISVALTQAQFQVATDLAKPVVQILEIQDEDPADWLPDQVVKFLNDPALIEQATQAAQQQQMAAHAEAEKAQDDAQPLFVDQNDPDAQPGAQSAPASGGAPTAVPPTPTSPQDQGPETATVVPKDQIRNPVADSNSSTAAVRT